MNLKFFIIPLFLLSGCMSLTSNYRKEVEDCVIKMRNTGGIPPSKAYEICSHIYNTEDDNE